MSVVRDVLLTVVNKDSVVSVVSEVKHRSERTQRFHFNNSKVKQRSKRSQKFLFTSRDVKQCSEHSQIFNFNSIATKTP